MKTFNVYKKIPQLALISLLTFSSACDSNISFNATRADSKDIPSIIANLTPTQTGASIIRIPNLSSVPEDIRNGTDIEVVFDNSKAVIPVTKNSDGSLSFPTTTSVRIDSEGKFNVIFIVDNKKSYLVTIKTGPVLKLKNPGVLVTPATGTIIKGQKIQLKANTPDGFQGKLIFNWYYGSSASGPFFSISGTGESVEWTPSVVGNYFVKLEMIDPASGSTSNFISPISQVFVTDAKNIINVSPASGTILRGKKTTLTANIPNISNSNYEFNWSYGVSAQGPFLPISGNTSSVSWTPSSSGSFFIKLDALNKESNETATYNTTEPLVFVTENEDIIKTEPSSGSIVRGNSLKLNANVPVTSENSTYSWSYGATANGPWLVIPGAAKTIDWTPPTAGTYFVKTDVTDNQTNNVSTFISPKALVFVNEANNIFSTNPILANIKRGRFVNVTANIPGAANKPFQYNWSYSTTPQGPFLPLNNVSGDIKSNTIKWRPASEGSFYVKVDAVNIESQSVVSFTSPNPIVFVNEITPLFTTNPEIARITKDFSVDIMVDLEASNSTFAWSYGPSTVGPWFSLGGTTTNKITWDKKTKPTGTYYVKVDIQDSNEKSLTSYVSRSPIIFVDESSTSSSGAGFGI